MVGGIGKVHINCVKRCVLDESSVMESLVTRSDCVSQVTRCSAMTCLCTLHTYIKIYIVPKS